MLRFWNTYEVNVWRLLLLIFQDITQCGLSFSLLTAGILVSAWWTGAKVQNSDILQCRSHGPTLYCRDPLLHAGRLPIISHVIIYHMLSLDNRHHPFFDSFYVRHSAISVPLMLSFSLIYCVCVCASIHDHTCNILSSVCILDSDIIFFMWSNVVWESLGWR